MYLTLFLSYRPSLPLMRLWTHVQPLLVANELMKSTHIPSKGPLQQVRPSNLWPLVGGQRQAPIVCRLYPRHPQSAVLLCPLETVNTPPTHTHSAPANKKGRGQNKWRRALSETVP